MTNSTVENKMQKISKVIHQSPLKKFKNKQTKEESEIEKPGSSSLWIKSFIADTFKKSSSPSSPSPSKMVIQDITVNTTSNKATPISTTIATTSNDHPLVCLKPKENTGSTSNDSKTNLHEKEIVPLRHFLRYSMDQSDQRTFKYRRMMKPFEVKYEIEWQKDQWLQLDNTTSKQIERLRQSGFSKIAIRKDASLKKHIKYDNPNEMDVLLELSLQEQTHPTEKEPQPIVCHQPTHFPVRRTQWWQTSFIVGVAHLPDWVDPDLCCDAVMMDAPAVLAAISSYSRSSLNSYQQSKSPDTPSVSQRSSMVEFQQNTTFPGYKPLRYTEPPYLMETSIISSST